MKTVYSILACAVLAAAAPVAEPEPETFRVPVSNRHRYQKREDGTVNIPALIEAINRPLRKYSGRTVTLDVPLDKRAVSSEALTDQIEDGEDELYYGNAVVGASTPQTFTVDFDTGSSDFFVPGPSCGTSQGCVGSTKYDQGGTNEKNTTSVTYGSGSVSGNNYFDTVCVAGLCATHTNVISLTTAEGFSGSDSEGLMGMAFQSIAESGQPPFFQQLISQGKVTAPEFSFFLGRGKSNTQGLSELTLGGRDSSRYTGAFTNVPVTTQGYWQVALAGAYVSGSSAGPTTNGQAAIDTGTTVVLAPTVAATAIYAKIPGAFPVPLVSGSPSETIFAYPCNTKSVVSLEFAGKQFKINPLDFNFGSLDSVAVSELGSPESLTSLANLSGYCIGGIIGGDIEPTENLYVVGDVFLKNWYAVFSHAQPSVLFAAAKGNQ